MTSGEHTSRPTAATPGRPDGGLPAPGPAAAATFRGVRAPLGRAWSAPRPEPARNAAETGGDAV